MGSFIKGLTELGGLLIFLCGIGVVVDPTLPESYGGVMIVSGLAILLIMWTK